jgi:YVTN family beta-propeller protein
MKKQLKAILIVLPLLFTAGAWAQARSALLILNKSENTMAIIDPTTLKVVARVPTGEAPHEVATSNDGRLAFVANYGTATKPGNTISVIDLTQQKEIRRIDLGALLRPHGITEAGGKIYFTVEGSRAVARLDIAAGRIDWIMGTGQAGTHMVVVTPDQKKVYTANINSNTVTAIELSTSRLEQIAVGKGPEGIAISPDGRQLWVAHRQDGGLSIIDTATDKVKETIKVGRSPIRVKFTPDGKRVLVSDVAEGELVIFDAATQKEIKRIKVGNFPVGVLIAPDGRRAFVAATRDDKVFVIDLENLSLEKVIEPGREPDGMAWAGK